MNGAHITVPSAILSGTDMRTIALEEHFVSPNFVSGPGSRFMEPLRGSGPRGPRICEQLQELGDARIA